MGNCQLIKENGHKCGSPHNLVIFYFRDCLKLYADEIEMCQSDSDAVFGKLMIKEQDAKLKIEKLQNERKKYFESSYETTEVKNYGEELSRKIERWQGILNDIRNKTCRLCEHPLTCSCNQCFKRHNEDKISSATLFSQKLYRRSTFNFHKICGRIFLARFGINLLPSSTGQYTLD